MPEVAVFLYSYGEYSRGKSFGAYLVLREDQELQQDVRPVPPDWCKGRDLGPLLWATQQGLDWCYRQNYHDITVRHVHEGVGAWPEKRWRANKDYTKHYRDKVRLLQQRISIWFEHIVSDQYCRQLQHACRVALGTERPQHPKLPFHQEPFPVPSETPEATPEANVACPRCLSADPKPRLMRRTPEVLVCPDCHHRIPDHQTLSFERWRDCRNPSCGATNCLQPRVVLGEPEPTPALVCPFCYTCYLDQPRTEYWQRAWRQLDPVGLDWEKLLPTD